MTDQELTDLVASLAIDSKEMYASQKDLHVAQKETSEQMRRTNEITEDFSIISWQITLVSVT
ncbi:MAG: hypothetical protein NTY69_02155 [Methylococcales bacterium]|nr:hypothetical protein [Methylococcales bacterium]